MEPSKRVVFVSLVGRDDGKPRTRRKRALGVSETATWDEFCHLIKARLQLTSVRHIYHASTMTPLTAMSELRDIEDLVVDGDEAASTSAQTPILPAGAAGVSRTGLAPASVAVHLPSAAGASGDDGDDDAEKKYKKRAPLLRQLAQSFAPSWAGSLPASLMGGGGSGRDDGLDAMEGGGVGGKTRGGGGGTPAKRDRDRRHRRTDPRVVFVALSLLSCLATMVLLYSRLSAKLPPP